MASIGNVILGSAAALLVWTCIGVAVARAVLPQRALWWPVAPALGWAVHSAATLPLFMLVGFNRITVMIVTVLSVAAAAYALWRQPRLGRDKETAGVPLWAWIGALVLALSPASAILPKFVDGAVVLSGPIFDHVKVAMIDEMVRLGLPPGNPFFGEEGQPSRLVYYYLLHFSAAELALLLGISGWEADAALTWFSAFASLMLMVGLATWISGRKLAALLVLLVCATGSLRPLLAFIPGIDSVIMPQTGFAGWLFQSAWVPQHIASASCVVLAILLLSELVRRESFALLATFVLVVVAGVGSSTWVGGVTFAIAAIWIGGTALANAEPQQRMPLLGRFAIAAIGAVVLAAPILYDQIATTGTRGGGSPIALQTYEVLGEFFAPALRQLLDMPAFWLILLVIELPAIYLTGVYAMLRLTPTLDPDRKRVATILIHLAGVSLAVAWLMVSTIGGNNDLGWRAVLPACIVLTVFAVAGLCTMDQDPHPARHRRLRHDRARPAERPRHHALLRVRYARSCRRGVRGHARDVGRGAPPRRAGRPCRQQSDVSGVDDAVAGQYLMGAPVEPPVLLRRLRPGLAVHPAAAGALAGDRCPVPTGVLRRRLAR